MSENSKRAWDEEPTSEEKTQSETVDWQRPATWPEEIGGSRGPEPTRYGDWERNGRCTDF